MNFTKIDFKKEVLESSVPVLVDFSAAWCGPCRAIAPAIEQIAHELGDKAKVVTIDVDSETSLAEQYGVRSIPTLVVIKGGQEVDRMLGAAPKDVIKANFLKHF